MTNYKISNYLINRSKTILNAINLFDSNRCNLLIVINNQKKFEGVITISDIRRALVNGYTVKSSIKKFVNTSPVVVEDGKNIKEFLEKIDPQVLQDLDPPLIPIINKKKIPIKLIDKDNLKILDLKKDKKQRSILLIGGAGYIGNAVCKKLLSEGYKVTIFDKFIYNSKLEVKKFHKNKNLTLIKGDTRDLKKTFEAIKSSSVVIHLAEMVGDPLCEIRPEKTYEVNFLASITIANICKNLELEKFIYVSSCSVYGSSDKDILTEKSLLNPLSVYAKLKIICEKAITQNSGASLQPCILRLGTVFGNSFRQRYDLVVNLFSGLIAKKKEITINGGNQWRPFVHVDDVATAISKVVHCKKSLVNGKIFNIVGENYKISNIGEIIKKKYPWVKIKTSNENKDLRNYRASNLKAKQILKFKPKNLIKNDIPKIIKKITKNKIKNIFSKNI